MHALNVGVKQVTCVQVQVCRIRIPGLSVRSTALLPCKDFVGGGSFLDRIATSPPLMTLRSSSWPVAIAPGPLFWQNGTFGSFRRSLTNTLPRDAAARPSTEGQGRGLPLFCHLALRSWACRFPVFDRCFERAHVNDLFPTLRNKIVGLLLHAHLNSLLKIEGTGEATKHSWVCRCTFYCGANMVSQYPGIES